MSKPVSLIFENLHLVNCMSWGDIMTHRFRHAATVLGKITLGKMAVTAAAMAALLVSDPAPTAELGISPGLPAPPVISNWTGFYLGANFGFAFNFEDLTTPIGGPMSTNPAGVMGGGQLGYNYRLGNWLVGIEAEFDATAAQGRTNFIGPAASTWVTSDQVWYGTLTGRLGYLLGPLLVYGKAGGAWMNANYQYALNSGLSGANSTYSTRSGWNAGAGFEYLMTERWSAKIEYDYLDFGTETLNFDIPFGTGITFKTQVNEVKAGLNYRWAQ
jgi:opacity protein-like surface antigen